MIDFAKARRAMVDSQLRPTDVIDRQLLTAMLDVPRERFVPAELAGVAYLDRDLPVDAKRALLKPMVLARMIQAAEVASHDRVLDVACGSGYSSAVLARLAASVTALEDDADRARRCGENLAQLTGPGSGNVAGACGPLEAGWPAGAPYDVILVNGACETEPQGLLRQLNEGGRLVAIIGTAPVGKATLFRKDHGEIGSRPLFDAMAPALPAFAQAPAFVF
jgi:protein-L-isoaspartate(D-aspartate) O-methyltransferase